MKRFVKLFFLIFVGLEILVFFGIAAVIGFAVALLLLMSLTVLGIVVLRSQAKSIVELWQNNLLHKISNKNLCSSFATLGGILLVIPGFITGIVGLILLLLNCSSCWKTTIKSSTADAVTADIAKKKSRKPFIIEGKFKRNDDSSS